MMNVSNDECIVCFLQKHKLLTSHDLKRQLTRGGIHQHKYLFFLGSSIFTNGPVGGDNATQGV